MTVKILKGDCREVLRTLPDESVHCVVTSPPYWGLRDYGVAGQIGLEGSFAGYVEQMRNVFAEVRRVLRKDGTLWLNLGDSYAGSGVPSGRPEMVNKKTEIPGQGKRANASGIPAPPGLKVKDMVGIPWRVAFALQADGWWLRQDIIWSKPNPMPESVTDRCTKAHEYIFLLSKSERYFYDAEAIKEEGVMRPSGNTQHKYISDDPMHRTKAGFLEMRGKVYERVNRRSVWEVTTQPFSEAHFATFPPALIEPCIMAGTSEKGCCAKCGAPWVRQTESTCKRAISCPLETECIWPKCVVSCPGRRGAGTTGLSPSCSCAPLSVMGGISHEITPCTVLDPFGGAGTTGLVADRLGRNAILIELNPEYAEMAERRLRQDAGMFADVH